MRQHLRLFQYQLHRSLRISAHRDRGFRTTVTDFRLALGIVGPGPGMAGHVTPERSCRVCKPAAIRYTASNPQLLNWVALWNSGNPYEEQIRPFGFLLSFMPRKGKYSPFEPTPLDEKIRRRPPKSGEFAPIAPYENNPAKVPSKVFDRLTGNPVDPDQLKTYAEVLAQYHLSSGDKFENGQFLDRADGAEAHLRLWGHLDWEGGESGWRGWRGASNSSTLGDLSNSGLSCNPSSPYTRCSHHAL
jgi:hypothetical protein